MKSFLLTIFLCILCFSICIFNFDNVFTNLLGWAAMAAAGYLLCIVVFFPHIPESVVDTDMDIKDCWKQCTK